jgi:hypothetical protein
VSSNGGSKAVFLVRSYFVTFRRLLFLSTVVMVLTHYVTCYYSLASSSPPSFRGISNEVCI